MPQFSVPEQGTPLWLTGFERWLDRVRYWSGPVLILGGESRRRESLARLVHDNGPTGGGWFRPVNCRSRPRALGDLLETAVVPCGTLFLDWLEVLPPHEQRRLIAWLDAQAGAPAPGPGRWRVLAGVERAEAGGVLPMLFDSLDKWRIDLRGQ